MSSTLENYFNEQDGPNFFYIEEEKNAIGQTVKVTKKVMVFHLAEKLQGYTYLRTEDRYPVFKRD